MVALKIVHKIKYMTNGCKYFVYTPLAEYWKAMFFCDGLIKNLIICVNFSSYISRVDIYNVYCLFDFGKTTVGYYFKYIKHIFASLDIVKNISILFTEFRAGAFIICLMLCVGIFWGRYLLFVCESLLSYWYAK